MKEKNPGGRPPVDLEVLAEELLEWSQQPHAINLIGFTSPKRMSVTKLPHYANIDEKFREALDLAKENIHMNRQDMANADLLKEKFFLRCEGMYDPLYRKYDREEEEFKSSLRKEEQKQPQQINIGVKHDGLGSGLRISAKKLSDTDNKGSE